MAVTVYKSTDASAPTLAGTAGSLVNVLDACLVNGYGSQPAAGWTKEFSGTNKAVYRQPVGSNQFYLRIDDTATATTARIVAYESMSGIDTGTGAFPTEAQQAGGLYTFKSNLADAVSRAWTLITNGKFVYFLVNYLSATPVAGLGFLFGDFKSYKSGDAFNTILIAGTSTGTTLNRLGQLAAGPTTAALIGHFVARSYTQTGTALAVSKLQDVRGSTSIGGATALIYPSPVDSSLQMSRVLIHEPSVATRGYLPGAYQPLHLRPLTHYDTFNGSGEHAGKSFIVVNINDQSTVGQIMLETSGDWS